MCTLFYACSWDEVTALLTGFALFAMFIAIIVMGTLVGIEYERVLPDERRHNLCIEIDRATMSVAARRLSGKSSFGRKIRAYFAAWEQDRHREQWGFQGFRVLTVTPSESRIKGMLTVQRRITSNRAAAMFLYTTPQRLAEHGALAPVWISADSDGQRLLQETI